MARRLDFAGNNPRGVVQRLRDLVSLVGNLPPLVPAVFPNLWSARFVRAASQYAFMNAVDFGQLSQTKFTIYARVKRNSVGTTQMIVNAWGAGANSWLIQLNASNLLEVYTQVGITNYLVVSTTALTSTADFYDLVVQVDTAAATNAERCKIFIDEVQETTSGTAASASINLGDPVAIGAYGGGGTYLDADVDAVAFVDGQTTDPLKFSIDGVPQDFTTITGIFAGLDFENQLAPWVDIITGESFNPVNAPAIVSNA